jgi:hypothetical protein
MNLRLVLHPPGVTISGFCSLLFAKGYKMFIKPAGDFFHDRLAVK